MIAKRLLASLLICMLTSAVTVALPTRTLAVVAPECDKSSFLLGIPPWYKYLDVTYDTTTKKCDIVFPHDSKGVDMQKTVAPIALAIFEIILRIGAIVAIGFVVYGGIQYVISQGEPERTKNARTTILNAIIGLVITIFSTAIVNLIARNIGR